MMNHWGRRHEIALRLILPLLLICSSLMSDGRAQSKSSPKHVSSSAIQSLQAQGTGSVSVTLTSVPDGPPLSGSSSGRTLDLGTVSYATGARVANVQVNPLADRFVVTTRFGMSIQDTSRRFSTAAVLASIVYPENVFTLWIDGVKLTTTPQMIQGQTRLGPALEHRLRIEVPASSTEKNSQLNNAVIFQVVPN